VSAPAAATPSGGGDFLFTDVEGSTRRWETDAEAMRAALATHDQKLRGVIEAHGGWLFKHTGDGVCTAFNSRSPPGSPSNLVGVGRIQAAIAHQQPGGALHVAGMEATLELLANAAPA